MKIISFKANYGWDGANRMGTIEVPDECTKEEIEEIVYDEVTRAIELQWEEI